MMMQPRYLVMCYALLLGLSAPSFAAFDDDEPAEDRRKPSASDRANRQADQSLYRPIEYRNADTQGPTLIVIPGQIKSNNASFEEKISPNNIADFAELELGRANFRVLERSDLGPLLKEIGLAVNMGDPSALKQFKRGKFKSTKWFVKFDILKAEPVASAKEGFDGNALGGLLGGLINDPRKGRALESAFGSVQTEESAQIWIIGMRYKVLDANTTEQVSSGYFEEKMELGASSQAVLGQHKSEKSGVTLDTLVQRLVQQAVADLDTKK
jgi:hypothetical protein